MKTNKIIILILALAFGISFNSCVEDADYSVPKSLGTEQEPNITGQQVTFTSVKAKLAQSGGLGTYDASEDIYIVGYVVSSDRTGNFFEELIIQNTPTDADLPTEARMGLKVNIDVNDLSNKYNFGRKVYLKLAGLTVTEDSGVTAIGKLDRNNELRNIESFEINDFLFRSTEKFDIIPKSTTIEDLTENDLNTIINLDNIQFSDTSRNLTFAGEADDEFNGERLLTSCEDGSSIILNTSTFSDFKSQIVPDGSGTLTAVYGKNFFGDTDILTLNTPDDIKFTEDRCDLSVNLTPISIKELREMFTGTNKVFVPGSGFSIEGYVVSSDIKGNFFKNIYIQDKPVNPTAAIQILADENSLFQSYPAGSKVVVKLDRLYLGEAFGGVLSLGYLDDGEVDRITRGDLGKFLINTGSRETIVPTPATISATGITIDKLDDMGNPVDDNMDNITDQVEAPQGILIKVDNVQLPRGSIGEAYAFYSGTDSANRAIESCDTGGSAILRNSGFADFSGQQFPTGQGSIVAVLGEFGGTKQLLIRTTNDVNLTGERCDPDFFECTGTTSTAKVVFEEDFQSISNESQLDGMGWTNVNVSGGSERFERNSFSGDTYLKISAFGTNESPLNAWLVTPAINLDNSTNEELSFEISSNFETGKVLEAYITENYTGDPTTTEWKLLDANIPIGDGGFGSFVQSKINISCLNGDVHVAFKYFGADGASETRYHIDDIKVTGD